MDEIMTRCNLEKNPVQKSTHEELQRTEPQFLTFVWHSKMGIHMVLSFAFVSLKHVFGYSSGQ